MRSFNKEETFKLIAAFEQHPCLWQKANPLFKNLNNRTDALKEMAAMFDGCTEKDVKGTILNYSLCIYDRYK